MTLDDEIAALRAMHIEPSKPSDEVDDDQDPWDGPPRGKACAQCVVRPATVWFAEDATAGFRGWVSPWCRICTLARQVTTTREAAERLPGLEAELKAAMAMDGTVSAARQQMTYRSIEDVKAALEQAWSADTSMVPGRWTGENPQLGQCAVTALIVSDLCGGQVLVSKVNGEGSHYWNRLPNGEDVDLTFEQFPSGTSISPPRERDAEELLANEDTRRRYITLASRVRELLKG